MGFLFLAAGLVSTILVLGSNHRKVSQEQYDMERAMDVAEAGVERGARLIEANITALSISSTGATNGSGSIGAGTYAYVVTRTNNIYTIVSTGTVNNVTRTVSLTRIYQPSYAEFALWSSNNASLYFKDGETFNGHVHADTQFYFDNSGGGPVFHSYVDSKASTYVGDITGIEFDKGLNLGTSQGTMADVNFSDTSSANCLKTDANSSSHGLVLDGTSTITFSGSSVKITNSRKSWSNHSWTIYSDSIIYVENATSGSSDTAAKVYLTGGSVTGRLTVVSEDDMYIRGNITYGTDPVAQPTSTDALALISKSDVWVDTTAPNNLTIDAAVMATGQTSGTDGSFGVVNYDSGNPRGTLNVYGGIVQLIRGAVGTFDSHSGATTHGYAKNYSYDPRFINNPPPYFPVISDKVTFSQWSEGH